MRAANEARLICFDLDGVIYSAEPFLGDAYREAIALVEQKRPGSFERVPSTREILDHVGWPMPVILARLFPRVDDAAVELLYAETLEVICRRVAACEGVLYPGVEPTLRALRRGRVLAIASNGRRRYIETVLSTYGLADCFAERITADQVGDKTAVLRAYLERCALGAESVIMVGDRSSDVEAARAVGCRFIGCDYGHGHRDEIESAGPIIGRFEDLIIVVGVEGGGGFAQ
jgi:phosphoglycolate phosphatase